VFVAVLFCTTLSWAHDSEEPIQEVFKSDLVFAQEAGEFQFSIMPQYAQSGEESSWAIPLSIEYGITDNLQLEFEWVSYGQNDPHDEGASRGIGDAEIGLQYSWMEISGSEVHAALGLEVGIPLGDDKEELGEGEKSLATYLVLGVNFTDSLHAFMQLGVEYPEHETRERYSNVGLVGKITDDAALTLEYSWQESERYITPGLVWSPADDWELGLGVSVGLDDEANDYQFILHIIIEMDS
jgi:hypothetical protein